MKTKVETNGVRNQQQRIAYQPPRLITYGAVRELTAAGSGSQQEKGMSANNASKQRP